MQQNQPQPHLAGYRIYSVILVISLSLCLIWLPTLSEAQARRPVRALFIPLADHYAAIVAYEKYRSQMIHADFQLERQNGPWLVRTRFRDTDVDMAFEVAPMAMDMFRQHADFRWIGLMHRDGNALAVNELLDDFIGPAGNPMHQLPKRRRIAEGLQAARKAHDRPVEIGLPHPQATHTAVLYKFLKDHGLSMGLGYGPNKDVVTVRVTPPNSPGFIKRHASRGVPAGFEQSLPWPNVAEHQGAGRVIWYSKDVLRWPHGHVECIILAKDRAIAHKREAVAEVVRYIHQAGQDIERARRSRNGAMDEIITMIRRHIPEHTPESIRASLDADLNAINYRHLNVDKEGMRQIMQLSVEAGMIHEGVDLDAFADETFATDLTNQDLQAPVQAHSPGD